MILQKITLNHPDRNATTVDEFYYKDLDEKLNGKKGTGVRALAAEFIRTGKALDRFILLKNQGCTLETYMIFTSVENLNEFINHPITKKAGDFFAEKGWSKTIEIQPIDDYLNVRTKLEELPFKL